MVRFVARTTDLPAPFHWPVADICLRGNSPTRGAQKTLLTQEVSHVTKIVSCWNSIANTEPFMSHFKSWIIFLVLSVVGVGVGAVSGQSCQSCLDSSPTHQFSGLENECPGGKRCRQHVTGRQGRLNCRDRCQHLKEINQLVSQRNVAWPKPFTCADRQLYFKTWEPMLDTGWRASCIFTDRHFVAGTADLNQAGQMKMSAIRRQVICSAGCLAVRCL